MILTGQFTKKEALDSLKQSPYDKSIALQDFVNVANKLDMTKNEFIKLMEGENKTSRDYKSREWLIKKAIKVAKLLV